MKHSHSQTVATSRNARRKERLRGFSQTPLVGTPDKTFEKVIGLQRCLLPRSVSLQSNHFLLRRPRELQIHGEAKSHQLRCYSGPHNGKMMSSVMMSYQHVRTKRKIENPPDFSINKIDPTFLCFENARSSKIVISSYPFIETPKIQR